MAGINILVCGGRDFEDYHLIAKTLSPFRTKTQLDYPTLIVGYDPEKDYPHGADKLAYRYAEQWGWDINYFPYHYHLGKAGGGSRNQQMLDEGKPNLVIAFPTPTSKGTWDMVRRAKKAGVETIVVISE